MTTMPQVADQDRTGARVWLAPLVFWLGLALLAAPTLYENYQQSWRTEQGQQGPLVLAIACWLLWRVWPEMWANRRPGSLVLSVFATIGLAVAYVVGRLADQYVVESYALYGIAVSALFALVGIDGMKRGWFPLAFFLFALPVPYAVTLLLTSQLRLSITEVVVASLQSTGMQIVRDGLNIMVDQYVLAVAEACSGMNSLFSLSAIGLVYIYIRRQPTWIYMGLMLAPIVFFAIFGNFVRVVALVLMTHFFGDAVAQGPLHEGAGFLTFIVALLGVIGLDAVVGAAGVRISVRSKRAAS